MRASLQFIPYVRPFVVPLVSARGHWFEREGILLRIEDREGRVGYGEVAPLPAFGTETFEEASAYLGSLQGRAPWPDLEEVEPALRCCRFALGSAWRQLRATEWPRYRFTNCALLPSGETAMEAIGLRAREGFRIFKLKIGVGSLNDELALLNSLLSLLPEGARLRLDANGGLKLRDLEDWQTFLMGTAAIEFLEQPLPRGDETTMAEHARHGDLEFALDESVASVDDFDAMVALGQWPGVFVLKASIMGAPDALLRAAAAAPNPLVFSSVFETAIGLHAVLSLAAEAGARAPVGFGTLGFFADELNGFVLKPELRSEDVSPATMAATWEAVCSDFARS
jgi:O-succinylbenzoate synthase